VPLVVADFGVACEMMMSHLNYLHFDVLVGLQVEVAAAEAGMDVASEMSRKTR